jgi:hypothetical protein
MYLAAMSYAVASYPVVFILVLKWANPLMYERAEPLPMLLEHLLYGIALAAAYRRLTAYQRRS